MPGAVSRGLFVLPSASLTDGKGQLAASRAIQPHSHTYRSGRLENTGPVGSGDTVGGRSGPGPGRAQRSKPRKPRLRGPWVG